MESKNKRYIISFNGEIYNFQEIKQKLKEEKVKFKSNSDTEVLIEAISNWGIKKTLIEISGMYAFALLDKKYKKIYLVRDRFGIKPLYFSFINGLFLFNSILRSLRAFSNAMLKNVPDIASPWGDPMFVLNSS